jgi:hypothetical protein
VGYQRDAEPDGRGRDPSVGVVVTLGQGVPAALAADPEFDVGLYKSVAGPHHLRAGDVELEALKTMLASAPEVGPVAEFGHRWNEMKSGRPRRLGR